MQQIPLDNLAGFRRRFRITPEPDRVCCELEDDYHSMRVTVCHDGVNAIAIDPHMRRAPWTTCPGAEEELRATFTGLPLSEFGARGAQKSNCTHLYDLVQLAAAHAFDSEPRVYDVLVSDPLDGRRWAELRRDGDVTLSWMEEEFNILEPEELAGTSLWDLRSWMVEQEPTLREAAKLLRWANIMANGRLIPIEEQSDASKMPPNCYTFQPERAVVAKRIGEIKDFSVGAAEPLAGYRAFA